MWLPNNVIFQRANTDQVGNISETAGTYYQEIRKSSAGIICNIDDATYYSWKKIVISSEETTAKYFSNQEEQCADAGMVEMMLED